MPQAGPPQPDPHDVETGRRLRAAFAYARRTRKQAADALGVGQRHVARYESGQTPIPGDLLDRAAEATGVPRWFFDRGFAGPAEPEDPTAAERVEALEHRLDALTKAIREEARERNRELLKVLSRVAELEAAAASAPGRGGIAPGARKPGRRRTAKGDDGR